MRPEILYPLFSPVRTLKGVGSGLETLLKRLSIETVWDLLCHKPYGFQIRRGISALSEACPGELITVQVKAVEHVAPRPHRGRPTPYKIYATDGRHGLDLIFFSNNPAYLQAQLPLQEVRVISGRFEHFQGKWQMTHPDHIGPPDTYDAWCGPEALYPLTQGLTQKTLKKLIFQALERLPELPEWLPSDLLDKRKWNCFRASLLGIHAPASPHDVSPLGRSRARLAFDELLGHQLSLLKTRRRRQDKKGISLQGSGILQNRVLKSLPYTLTNAQLQALQEIREDLKAPFPMHRLLQGDVGSGKTIVVFLSLSQACEAGFQGAVLAPTEILARQHFETMKPWAEAAGLSLDVYTGRDQGKRRKEVLEALESGALSLTIGTHALLEESVVFKNLGLIVIDEQHRFGVEQRLKLTGKTEGVNVLSMTATPIPRTLMLTSFGDIACSYLREKPQGRKEIQTRVLPLSRLGEVLEAVKRALNHGQRLYWVCPLVEESEALDLAAAEDRFASLNALFPGDVSLVHGRMRGEEKDKAVASFVEGKNKILVATTVIEVGVHVREATAMVIEHAERFGLAQLHQLRGRVGRGDKDSSCLLLYGTPLTEIAKRRLQTMRETADGFRIAEEDLRLRGGGDVLGTKQSGLPSYRFADLLCHQDLLSLAREYAQKSLKNEGEEAILSPLLSLFSSTGNDRFLKAG